MVLRTQTDIFLLEEQILFDYVINVQLKVFPDLTLWTVMDQFEIAKPKKVSAKAQKTSNLLLFPKHFSGSDGLYWHVGWRLFAETSWRFLARNHKISIRAHTLKNFSVTSCWLGRSWFWTHQPKSFSVIVPNNLQIHKVSRIIFLVSSCECTWKPIF